MRKKQTDTYCIIGLGRFGSAVATFLAESGCEVMVIDKNENKVRAMRKYTDMAFVTDDLSFDNLQEMGVGNCSTCIICIGEKLDVSMLTSLNAINLGVKRVIAKAVTAEHGLLLEKIGAESIFPEREMGIRLGRKLTSRSLMEYMSLSRDIEISETEVSGWLTGKTLAEAALRSKYNLNVIAISHGEDRNFDLQIDPNYPLQEGDVLVAVGKTEDVRRFEYEL